MITTIPIIATKLEFTKHCLVYTVKPKVEIPSRFLENLLPFYTDKSISEKDLIAKNNLLCFNGINRDTYSDKVYFRPHNVTPQFYETLVNKIEPNFSEYESELDAIYLVGDVVGYVLV